MSEEKGKEVAIPEKLNVELGLFSGDEEVSAIPEGFTPIGKLDVDADTLVMEPGDSFMGVYLGFKRIEATETNDMETDSNLYMLSTGRGKYHQIWGSYQLDQKLPLAPVGDVVKISYVCDRDIGGGKSVKVFNVSAMGTLAELRSRQKAQGLISESAVDEDAPF